ncbi:hypothetical protein AAIE21_22610 [Paenibacillus sp. 102]|uniref:hypothetical protein n=1 Tax=Paenibacillus sp. 102 TaxID=3120823 RepID=UPI0031BB10CE
MVPGSTTRTIRIRVRKNAKPVIIEDLAYIFVKMLAGPQSILCYRVGAYRASFLMSYLGFMKILKERLLKSECPALVKDDKWEEVREKIKNDNAWETAVFNTTQSRAGSQNNYYLINDEIMEDIKFWKRKRNECAHAKDTVIGYSHVDMFWLFIESNLMKFVVNGGKEGLLARIDKHFKSIYIDPTSDASYLIKDIPLVVKPSEISELLKEIYDKNISLSFDPDESVRLFWRQIIYSSDSKVYNASLEFIMSEEKIFCDFMTHFPDKLIELKDSNDEFVRVLWKQRIFSKIYIDYSNFWELVYVLLTHKLIPDIELQGFIQKLTNCLSIFSMPNEDQTKVLKGTGFFAFMKKDFFESGNLNKYGGYKMANSNSHRIMYYIKNIPLDGVVVKELNTLFAGLTSGSFYESMKTHIQVNPQFISDFRKVASENEIPLTDFFKGNTEVIVS